MRSSPFRFKGTPELAREMNLSETAIRALRRAGAPFIAQKSHPQLLLGWMKRFPEKIPMKVE
jgi:hypothetical protein